MIQKEYITKCCKCKATIVRYKINKNNTCDECKRKNNARKSLKWYKNNKQNKQKTYRHFCQTPNCSNIVERSRQTGNFTCFKCKRIRKKLYSALYKK